jgi:hypothetical protein
LILKFSAGKYKNIRGEFSKVSVNSIKIGQIVKTKKPAITNDAVNDVRIKHRVGKQIFACVLFETPCSIYPSTK